ncbi:hypothetical protein GGI07_004105 [Coemansia sp. Benny D115]|nr:hypothetical protein GGI07_004105 [Coemansia sp. Benny D115]
MPIKHPRIKCIDVNANLIHFTDNSTIAIPDHIIYATGYLHVYPFIDNAHSLDTLACNTSLINNARSDLLFTDGHGVDNLYKFLLYIYNPTLAVFGVPQKIAPFPFYEYQAYYLTQVFQGLVPLPSFKEMLKEWNSLQAEYPPGSKKVFELGMRQIDYRNDLIETVSKYADANDSPSGQRLKYVAPDSRWADRCFNTFVNRKKLLGY